jgi:D-beta-D-heptose 7-phosphate kinase/D-beta-D-heptose 1-phosphate adenosyltransferase
MLKNKIVSLDNLVEIRNRMRRLNKTVVFTNGVFDLIHRGHVEYLYAASQLGDLLIVGLNSDKSARRIKGPGKPIINQEDRAIVLAGLSSVDYICYFEKNTPIQVIENILPDILVKGGDYSPDEIVGKTVVESAGGKVVTIPLSPGISTTVIMNKVRKLKN